VHAELPRAKKSFSEYSSGMDFDSMRCTRHAACYIKGVPPDRISKSSPEVMAEIEPIFADYNYSPNSIFGDLIGKIGVIFHEVDPLGIVERDNPNQLDEYFPEADMVIWLHFSKNLTPRTFWAIWEYQFADSNPYKSEGNTALKNLYAEVKAILT
jgi:hypothetical protein